ncbi:DNA-binding protein [Shimwellia pseudoproteus]|uniref:helix-turn-helix transcriptional regulator n=1 Tax=Shimwellia pseudoproteus TaxID=570012 RepID=UPI0018ED4580|nr:DNA-binding protein [Shimwellia pseudoproteus]MBJ3816842.1 DNA-binding protein [Shimwellia pseudoproteus]
MEYQFTLRYQLAAQDSDALAVAERLGGGGCDDAVVGIGLPGRVALAFTREAPDAGQAIQSALADVQRIVPAAVLIEVAPDLVGLTDAAGIVGVSRQNMRKLMLASSGGFPAPVHEGSTAIWHLSDILSWLQSKGSYALSGQVIEVARVAMAVNVAKEARRLAPPL